MTQQRVLLLNHAGLTACRADSDGLHAEADFLDTPADIEAFGRYLEQHAGCLFALLVDVADEIHRIESIPRCSGKDRAAIIQRKLAQNYFGTPYVMAHSHGRLPSGRRDEQLLLMALTQPVRIDSWTDVLHRSGALLTGMYTLPQLLQVLPLRRPRQLLLLSRTSAGLRQTFFQSDKLQLSRLTPLLAGNADALTDAMADEAGRMHRYLASQRLLEPGQPLHTWVLAHSAAAASIEAMGVRHPDLNIAFVDLGRLARQAGYGAPIETAHVEGLCGHLLLRKRPKAQFAPAPLRLSYHLWRARWAMNISAVAMLAIALVFVLVRGQDVPDIRLAVERQKADTRLLEQTHRESHAPQPTLASQGNRNWRALTEHYQRISMRALGPAPLLAHLSHSLDANDAVEIDRVEWALVDQLESKRSTTESPERTGTLAATSSGAYAQAIVAARLPLHLLGDPQGQMAAADAFVRHLRRTPGIEAAILRKPADALSAKVFKSGEETRLSEAPTFVFQLGRKLTP